MERLVETLNNMFTVISDSVAKPNRLRAIVKDAGGDLNKSECRDIMSHAAAVFKEKCEEASRGIFKDCELENKLSELKELVTSSEKMNERLGCTEGYRPIEPRLDMTAEMKGVMDAYKMMLTADVEGLDDEIEETRALLVEREAVAREMSKRIEASLTPK